MGSLQILPVKPPIIYHDMTRGESRHEELFQRQMFLATECGFKANKVTAWQWVQYYSPILRTKLKKFLEFSTIAHHFDEIYIKAN